MSEGKDRPEIKREQMRQEGLKKPSSSIKGNSLADLVGGLGWKGAGYPYPRTHSAFYYISCVLSLRGHS